MRTVLGTGSTAFYAIERIGQKLRNGELSNIVCIPSSERKKKQALGLDIPLTTLDETSKLDISIDGADDVDLQCNLIKGAGGVPISPIYALVACIRQFTYTRRLAAAGQDGLPTDSIRAVPLYRGRVEAVSVIRQPARRSAAG